MHEFITYFTPCNVQTSTGYLLRVDIQNNTLLLTYGNNVSLSTRTVDSFDSNKWITLDIVFHLSHYTFTLSSTERKMHLSLNYSTVVNSTFDLILGNSSQFGPVFTEVPNLILSEGFEGCIRSVMSNGQFLNLGNSTYSNYPTLTPQPPMPGCPREEMCGDSNPCLNNGSCVSNWEGYTCDCSSDYMGENCSEGL